MNPMRLRTRIAIVIGLTVVIATLLFAAIVFQTQKRALIAGIDSKLFASAHLARSILGTDYHDNILTSDSVSEDEYLQIVDRWNRLCQELGLEYIWSLLLVDGRIVFTSGSSTSKDVSKGDHALFFEEHTNPGAYEEVFRTMEPDYEEIIDKWGRLRAMLIPFRDAQGRPYLFGASMKTTEVDALARRTLWMSLGISSAMFGLGMLLSLSLARSLSRPLENLTDAAKSMSEGDYSPPVEHTGVVEIDSLSQSIHSMSCSIQEKIAELRRSNDALLGEISERERAEEALRKSEKLYRDAIEVAGAVPYYQTYNPDSYTFVGSGITRMLGCTPEEFDSSWDQAIKETVPTGEFQGLSVDDAIARCRSEGLPWSADHRIKRPDGKERWIANAAIQIRDETGTVVGSLGILQDVTERKRSGEALRKSEELFRVLYEGTTSCILFIENRQMKYVNQATLRTFGYSRREMLDQETSLLHLSREKFEEGGRLVYPVLREEGEWHGEWPYRKKNGEMIWMETNITVLPSGGIVAILHDITERRKAKEIIKADREQLLSIFDSMDEVVYIADPETFELLYANDALKRKWGDWAGEKCFKVLQNRDAPCPFCTNDLILGENVGKTHIWEFENEVTRRWFRCIDRAIRWSDGRMVRFEMAIDITDLKQAEEERLSLERQVQHAQKLESLGVLAGGIAHDFNNLLMAILGNADLAMQDLSPMAPARDYIEEIEKASRRAAGLAKQMLAYSGKGRFVIEPIRINEFVEEMAHLLEVSISKKVMLKYNFAENLPSFEGDATQIRQVIMNLITNASEAIGDESGVIALSTGVMNCDHIYLDAVDVASRVRLDEPLAEGVYVFLEVSDSGCGVNTDTLGKIFDPFFTTKFTGRGLGLAAVLGIIRGHRGAIKIYSEVGKGTTFKVLFPAGEVSDTPSDRRRFEGAENSNWSAKGKVLIADDEETVRTVGKQMLERIGYEVLTAADGQIAVEVFQEHSDEIAFVLLDLTMPGLDGVEAYRQIRQIRGDTKVILCSGYNEQDAIQRFAGKGLAGFLQKPFQLKDLLSKLREVISD